MNPIILSTTGGGNVSPGLYLAFGQNGQTALPILRMFRRDTDTLTRLADPAATPPGLNLNSLSFSPEGEFLAAGSTQSPQLTVYRRDGDVLTKITVSPDLVLSNTVFGISWTPSATHLAAAIGSDSPKLKVYSRSGNTLTPIANPPAITAPFALAAKFSPDGTYLAVGQGFDTRYLEVYKRSGDTFTKLTITDCEASVRSLAWSPDGVYLAACMPGSSSAGPALYKRTGDTFARMANLASGTASSAASFSPDGVYLAVAATADNPLRLYKRSGDTFALLASPTGLIADAHRDVAFMTSDYVVAAIDNSPFVVNYKRSGDTFAKLPNPSVMPTAAGQVISVY